MTKAPKAATLPTTSSVTIDKYYPFLLEIRKRLLFIIFLFITATITGFLFYEQVINWILTFLNLQGVNIVFTSPFQFFTLAINSGIVIGLVTIFPLVLFQLVSFLKPALKVREFRLVIAALPIAIFLFVAGFLFGVFVMKYLVAIFYQKSQELHIGNILDIELLLSKIILTGALMGLGFQFPIIMTILMRLNIVKYRHFVKQRTIAYLLGLVFIVFLPPTDLISDIILYLPFVLLFELTLILNRLALKSHLL